MFTLNGCRDRGKSYQRKTFQQQLVTILSIELQKRLQYQVLLQAIVCKLRFINGASGHLLNSQLNRVWGSSDFVCRQNQENKTWVLGKFNFLLQVLKRRCDRFVNCFRWTLKISFHTNYSFPALKLKQHVVRNVPRLVLLCTLLNDQSECQ